MQGQCSAAWSESRIPWLSLPRNASYYCKRTHPKSTKIRLESSWQTDCIDTFSPGQGQLRIKCLEWWETAVADYKHLVETRQPLTCSIIFMVKLIVFTVAKK